jgi:hypothetical protein
MKRGRLYEAILATGCRQVEGDVLIERVGLPRCEFMAELRELEAGGLVFVDHGFVILNERGPLND